MKYMFLIILPFIISCEQKYEFNWLENKTLKYKETEFTPTHTDEEFERVFPYLKHEGDSDKIVVKKRMSKIHLTIGNKYQLLWAKHTNRTSVFDIITFKNEGEGIWYYFYQLEDKSVLSPLLSVEGDGHFDSDDSALQFKDIDNDGDVELIVRTQTHSNYGNLYGAGDIRWIDIYDISDTFKKSNEKYPAIYIELRKKIKNELASLKKQGTLLPNNDIGNVRKKAFQEWEAVYDQWLVKIDEIVGAAEEKIEFQKSIACIAGFCVLGDLTDIADIKSKYGAIKGSSRYEPSFYKRITYCYFSKDQKLYVAFSGFQDGIWHQGSVVELIVSQEKPSGECKKWHKPNKKLPEFKTPLGIQIGDSMKKVKSVYGDPGRVGHDSEGRTFLSYGAQEYEMFYVSITFEDEKVVKFHFVNSK